MMSQHLFIMKRGILFILIESVKIYIICEGSAENAIMDILLDHELLIFRGIGISVKGYQGNHYWSLILVKSEALEQQIELLILKREHLDNLILMAQETKMLGVK